MSLEMAEPVEVTMGFDKLNHPSTDTFNHPSTDTLNHAEFWGQAISRDEKFVR